MPTEFVRVQNIESLTPAVEARTAPNFFALSGRNFHFDSKGPRSGFGNRLIAGTEQIEEDGGVCQSITIGNRSYVFTTLGCYILADSLANTWTQILDLAPLFTTTADAEDKKWTAAYLTKGIYFCHPIYGFYKLVQNLGTFSLVEKTQDDFPGLPYKPQAIAESNGRLGVLGLKYFGWSSPESAEKFTPELGGAGQQLLSDRVTGDPQTMAGFQSGFLIWTTQGCLLAEFVGGDNVFRFDRVTTEQLPINQYAVCSFPNGTQVICTKQGLFQIENAKEPVKITPIFSEFLRQFLFANPTAKLRLDYFIAPDLLYLSIRNDTGYYAQTFVLSVALDKWGSFDEWHYGLIQHLPSREAFGYVDIHGWTHRFDNSYCMEYLEGRFEAIFSQLEIGYIRPDTLIQVPSSLHEIQEMFVGSLPSLPADADMQVINLNTGDFE